MTAPSPSDLDALLRIVTSIRDSVEREATDILEAWTRFYGPQTAATENLARYVALRRQDLRSVQRGLMGYGLSSLGRLESRVKPTLDAVATALAALAGEPPASLGDPRAFFEGERRLAAASDALFGAPRADRRGRIMVTLPGDAAGTGLVADLARRGMDVARINFAHDDPEVWRALAAEVRAAAAELGRDLKVIVDVAGPKIRTAAVARTGKGRVATGDLVRLQARGEPLAEAEAAVTATVSLPEIVERLEPGQRVLYDDGKLEGVVVARPPGAALVRVIRVKTGGTKVKPEKGLNLPDTDLGLGPLTSKDVDDLAVAAEIADMIGYSFVSRASDIDLLERALADKPRHLGPLAVVAKIERPEAIRNVPSLIARLAGRRPFGVMIARGDLAAEIGFTRLAEMQEELLWLCEAGAVPVIWATQVLEDLVKDGVPSRGEMTDAAMAARAECVMLNKGPNVAAAVDVLDELLGRMDEHLFKKTPQLRALSSW